MPIGATGIGSGLDIETLVAQLVLAETAPASTRLASKEATYQAELSALGSLKGALSAFDGSLAAVSNTGTFQAKSASSSDSLNLTATATTQAASGSYSLTISNIARAQSLVANAGFGDSSENLGTGTITISINGVDTEIQIGTAEQSLEGVANAINESDAKASAAVVFDGTNYRLALTAEETGLSNTISIAVSDDAGGNEDSSGLSRIASANLTETVTALDASLAINGLAITSASNSITNAIDGLTIELITATEVGETVTLSVSDNSGSITAAVNSFVSGYNELWSTLTELTSYDADSGVGSALTGEPIVRSIETQLRSLLNTPVENGFSSKSRLAEIGVTTNALTGNLELDQTLLAEAISSNPAEIAVIFSDYALSSNPNVIFRGSSTSTQAGVYSLSGAIQSSTSGVLSFSEAVTDFTYNGNGNDANFDISVDGAAAQTVSVSSNTGDIAGLLTELNSQITGATVTSDSNGALVFTSDSAGSGSSVTISNVDANAISGLKLSNSTGVDGTETYSYSIGGTVGSFDSSTNRVLGLAPSGSEGLDLELLSNETGNLGSVVFSRGIASQIGTFLDSLLEADGTLDSKIEGVQSSVSDLTEQQEALELRSLTLEARYRRQFNALDGLIAQLNTTQSFLTSALSGFVEPNTTLRK